jgi:beta-galactosidase
MKLLASDSLRMSPVLACLVTGCALMQAAEQTSPRATFNFNPGWNLFVGDPATAATPEFDDATWKPVTLPHAWNEDAAFKVSIAQHPTGIAWYRKQFQLPPDSAGKKVFLEFEGLRQGGEFYLNWSPRERRNGGGF